jgi:hypothetical protein
LFRRIRYPPHPISAASDIRRIRYPPHPISAASDIRRINGPRRSSPDVLLRLEDISMSAATSCGA